MKQLRIRIFGIVQGVGFRPFVSRLAQQRKLCGSVCNKGSFVEVHVLGDAPELDAFLSELKSRAPERAVILKMDVAEETPETWTDFRITDSEHRAGDIFVSPDIAVCKKCQTELYDAGNRRYLHPFINCTDCGPRLTILRQMPYDRARTTMGEFSMCPQCAAEYACVGDRRYDAQPVCCPSCGPQVYLLGEPKIRGAQAILRTRDVLRSGGIAAVKGIGGFHLCCDASNAAAVARLRERKHRPAKPFAVMARNLDTAKLLIETDETVERLLDSPQKPIVIGKKRSGAGAFVAEETAPETPTLGVMLPYAPLQLLLFSYPTDPSEKTFPSVLVMTSGNLGGAPICRDDADAAEQLAGICDVILSHDREILTRADDSVIEAAGGEPFFIRRSRGYAPLPVAVCERLRGQVLAVGGELKNAFCIAKDAYLYMSAHVGDLSDARAETALAETSGRMQALLEAEPSVVACDLHPAYHSAAYAASLGLPVVQVQHHYAHILSCMAENDALDARVIGAAFDGTGYGTDGSIWGGELLLCDTESFRRLGSVAPFIQNGGDAAAREGWRIAVSLLLRMYDVSQAADLAEQLALCSGQTVCMLAAAQQQGIGCVTSTSAGRLFDAVCALLGIKTASSYEGEAAQALQYAAQAASPQDVRVWEAQAESLFMLREQTQGQTEFVLDDTALWEWLVRARLSGVPTEVSAYVFHAALADGIVRGCVWSRAHYGVQTAALSGGCFCNRLLLTLVRERLRSEGFRVLTHRVVPANDGGLALGQAVAAMCGQHTSVVQT